MATARTNQLPNASFTVTAGTAKSLKITPNSRSTFATVKFGKAKLPNLGCLNHIEVGKLTSLWRLEGAGGRGGLRP